MFYLAKCAYEDCNRTGSVALENGDQVCNLHRPNTVKVEVELENKDQDGDQDVQEDNE